MASLVVLVWGGSPKIPVKMSTGALAGAAQSVGASSHKPKGCGFDSWSGHMPGLQVPSPIQGSYESNQSMFLSHIDVFLPTSLPPLLAPNNKHVLRRG